ncbi:RNA polymerase sigma factor [Microlunatus speluncae]|uniref:RNA polymerase sigma factor n=1 Tax=Microlunatus speluncae TaxID=2594267 RepID=UPI0012663904|nr:sigma-70 family RNA polymerase sigma factor [Microlunatus speluncae]
MTETEFDDLYARLAQPLLGYLLRRAASPEDAADLLAEVMTIVWTQRRALPPEEERRPWLFGIARNLLAQHRRRRTRRNELIGHLAEALLSVERSRPESVAELRLDLVRALRRLDRTDAEIITLSAWEGLTSREIGLLLGMPAATVRVRLKRTRERLQPHLEPPPGLTTPNRVVPSAT